MWTGLSIRPYCHSYLKPYFTDCELLWTILLLILSRSVSYIFFSISRVKTVIFGIQKNVWGCKEKSSSFSPNLSAFWVINKSFSSWACQNLTHTSCFRCSNYYRTVSFCTPIIFFPAPRYVNFSDFVPKYTRPISKISFQKTLINCIMNFLFRKYTLGLQKHESRYQISTTHPYFGSKFSKAYISVMGCRKKFDKEESALLSISIHLNSLSWTMRK